MKNILTIFITLLITASCDKEIKNSSLEELKTQKLLLSRKLIV